MANRNDDLILHLKLDDIDTDNKTVPDTSLAQRAGKVNGASLVADDIFGACLSFDGDNDDVAVSDTGLSDANPTHTLEAWIKVDANPRTRAWILLLGQKGNNSHHWLLNPKTADRGELQLGAWGKSGEQFRAEIPLRAWVHLATTYAAGKLNAYVNGVPIGEAKSTAFGFTERQLTLAGRGILSENNFQGQIACLRLYRRALSAAEIKEDMDADKMALPAYRDAHPIAFSLYDENENYVLYIDDDPKDEQRLTLELRNTSARAIRFDNKSEHASQDNYHFELVFRGGALSEKTLKILGENKGQILRETADWEVFSAGEDKQTGTTSLYFFHKGGNENFGPDHRLFIPLRNISAAAGTGARGTRIELRLHQLTYVDDTVPITGSRVQHLQIINHLGSRRVPLHVGFVGSHRILNDGVSANTLVLQVMNVLRSEQDTTITLKRATKFLISFDVQSSKEVAPWSLCTEEEIKNLETDDSIIVAKIENSNVVFSAGKPVPDTGQWSVERTDKGLGESPVWGLSPKTDLVLKRDDYIQIYISHIKTSLPSGLTNMYLEYKNIPGFWDGQVVCTIEKAPLLFSPGQDAQGKLERRVGINTLTPQNVLDVRGAVVIGKAYAGRNRAPDGTDLLVEGKVGIGATSPAAKLSVMGGVHVGGTSDPGSNNLHVDGRVDIGENLQFSNVVANSHISISRRATTGHDEGNVPSSLSLRILDGWGEGAGVWIVNERKVPGATINYGNNQYIRFVTHDAFASAGERMRIAPNGYVGIGATGPEARLDVNGDALIRGAIKGKYSGDMSDKVAKVSGENFIFFANVARDRSFDLMSLKRVGLQNATIIQGFSGATGNESNESHPPHLFAIGYLQDGKRQNSAIIIDLTTGAVSGVHKSFVIQHPLHQDRYLMHATLEGPEGAVYYRGTARLRDGKAKIQLPDYFESLTHVEGRTILLTNVDGFDQLAVLQQDGAKIKNGSFIVVSSHKESAQEFDWEVKAIRKDIAKLEVEPLKDAVTVERFGPYAYSMPKNGHKAE
jgi:hypothetical protein